MFRVIFRNLQQQITSNNTTSSHFINLVGVAVVVHNLHQNPFLKSISNFSKSTEQQPSFTVDYLVNSCGLSQEKALSTAKNFKLCSIEKADSVISLFQSYGLNKTHITHIISLHPQLLTVDPNKKLKPKFEFLSDLGVSEANDFSKIFTCSPKLLASSLEKVLIPNISLLQVHGVPNDNISKMLFSNQRSLCQSNRFKEIVEKVKKLGFDPLSTMFCRAVSVLSSISKSSWDKKLMVYGEYGLLENDVISAFKKQPEFMKLSEEKIKRSLDFFVKKLKCKPTDISFYPTLLMYSLEKRIVPRCAVLKILYCKGIIKDKLSLYSVLQMAERDFSAKFVIKYQETVPEVKNAYKGVIEFEGFGEGVEVKDYLSKKAVICHTPSFITAV